MVSSFEKDKSNTRSFNWNWCVEQGIRGGICHSIYQYAKAAKKYMNDYDKNKESSSILGCKWFIQLGNVTNQRAKVISQFNEDFIKNCIEESDEGYFLEVDVQYPEKLHGLYNHLPEIMKIEKVEGLVYELVNGLSYAHKKFKTSIKSWISSEEIA